MPNWCNGYVTVEGKARDVEDFCKSFIYTQQQGNDIHTIRRYFARSFIHTEWDTFKEDQFTNYEPNENAVIEFTVDFAWSAISCLIDGYPQRDEGKCITLSEACKIYNVKVDIKTEEPGEMFEEIIECNNKGEIEYECNKMKLYRCDQCNNEQAISSSDMENAGNECYECGEYPEWEEV